MPKKPRDFTAVCLTLLCAAFVACDAPIESAYNEQIVVSAFLTAGATIDSVILHRTTPFGSYYDDQDYAVGNAQVIITVDGVPHTMQAGLIKGRYYLPSTELIVEAG